MGRIFLVLIVVGALYGGYSIYSSVSRMTTPPEPKTAERARPAASVEPEGQDSGQSIKVPPVASSSQKNEPLPVLASNHEWIFVEAWGMVESGEELPDGSTLESWTGKEAVVVQATGEREKRRFRRPMEVLSKIAPVVAAGGAAGADSAGSSWGDK